MLFMNGINFSGLENSPPKFSSPPRITRFSSLRGVLSLSAAAVAAPAARALHFEEVKDEFSSPSRSGSSSRNVTPSQTPAKVRNAKRVLEDAEVGFDLPKSELKQVQEGIDELEQLGTPKRVKYTARMQAAIVEKFGPQSLLSSPGYHQRVAAGLRDNPQLARFSGQLHQLNRALPRHYVLIEHVAERHIFPADLQGLKVLENRRSGVSCGMVGNKFTTFYPRSVKSQRELIELLNLSEIVFEGDEHLELVRVPAMNERPEFYVEMAKRNDAVVITAYPIFFFGQYAAGTEYEICEGVRVTSNQLIEFMKELSDDFVRYSSGKEAIVDLAGPISDAFKMQNKLSEGVYFSFPKKLADRLLSE